jgi:hypothetical protein
MPPGRRGLPLRVTHWDTRPRRHRPRHPRGLVRGRKLRAFWASRPDALTRCGLESTRRRRQRCWVSPGSGHLDGRALPRYLSMKAGRGQGGTLGGGGLSGGRHRTSLPHGDLMRRPARVATLAALVAAGSFATSTQEAGAYSLLGTGCRYDPANDNDGLGIGFSSTNFHQGMRDATEDAAARWNAKAGTPAQFTIVSYSSSTRDLRVEFAYLGSGSGTPATLYYNCGSSHYTQDPRFEWNRSFTYPSSPGGYSLGQRRSVTGIHEIGHSYGMDHNQTSGCNTETAGLMFAPSRDKLESCGWKDPSNDDRDGAVDAHNG